MVNIYNVQVRPSRDLRNKYAEISNIVKEQNPVVITKNGRGDSVLISMEEYAKYEEYAHRAYVAEKLMETERDAKNPNMKRYSHNEIWTEIMGRKNV